MDEGDWTGKEAADTTVDGGAMEWCFLEAHGRRCVYACFSRVASCTQDLPIHGNPCSKLPILVSLRLLQHKSHDEIVSSKPASERLGGERRGSERGAKFNWPGKEMITSYIVDIGTLSLNGRRSSSFPGVSWAAVILP